MTRTEALAIIDDCRDDYHDFNTFDEQLVVDGKYTLRELEALLVLARHAQEDVNLRERERERFGVWARHQSMSTLYDHARDRFERVATHAAWLAWQETRGVSR